MRARGGSDSRADSAIRRGPEQPEPDEALEIIPPVKKLFRGIAAIPSEEQAV